MRILHLPKGKVELLQGTQLVVPARGPLLVLLQVTILISCACMIIKTHMSTKLKLKAKPKFDIRLRLEVTTKTADKNQVTCETPVKYSESFDDSLHWMGLPMRGELFS